MRNGKCWRSTLEGGRTERSQLSKTRRGQRSGEGRGGGFTMEANLEGAGQWCQAHVMLYSHPFTPTAKSPPWINQKPSLHSFGNSHLGCILYPVCLLTDCPVLMVFVLLPLPPANIDSGLLCAHHSAKHWAWIIRFNTHNNSECDTFAIPTFQMRKFGLKQ